MPSEILLVDDALFETHASRSNHPERPARLDAARVGVARAGVRVRPLPARDATRAELESAHLPGYLDSLDRLRGESAMLDPDTYVSPRSIEAAVRASGGVAELAAALVRREATRGMALVRPPGHHAEPDRAMGFCLLNNVAIGARAALAAGARKVAIVDFDVHHGNGTQSIFYRDPDVLFVSLHQWPFYPWTGSVLETGEGPGLGFTLNVPLGAGADDGVYREAIRRIVRPAVRDFRPDVLLLSAGYDAFVNDPLASMLVSDAGFGAMVGGLVEEAEAMGAPVGLVLEGGYDLHGLESCIAASARALLAGAPIAPPMAKLDPSHRAELETAATAAARIWRSVG
jgi:acetoin utilization deacetylase AcuC-like enzyme